MNYYLERQSRFEFKRDPDNGMLIGPDGCHYETEATALYFSTGLCGCGAPEEVHGFLIECLRQFSGDDRDARGGMKGIQRVLAEKPEIAAEFIAHYLDSQHLTEHGGSVYGSWLTDRGKQFMEAGNDHGED